MKVKAPPRMSSIQWFVSIAAGLAMFLLPQDAQSYFSDVYRQIFVGVVAFGIALVLLLLFKLYEPIGVAMLSSMFLTVITFAIRIGIRIYEGPSMEDFTMAVNVYDGVSWGMVWSMPLLCCFLMRIFAQGNWSEPEAKRDFCCFFQKASVASGCYLLILLLAIFLYFRPMNFSGMRQLNLVPFSQILRYIQAFQYTLNTGVADVDDVICSMAGFGLGCFVKYLLDRIRRSVTKGKEAKICYVWESQRRERRKGKTSDQAQGPAKE